MNNPDWYQEDLDDIEPELNAQLRAAVLATHSTRHAHCQIENVEMQDPSNTQVAQSSTKISRDASFDAFSWMNFPLPFVVCQAPSSASPAPPDVTSSSASIAPTHSQSTLASAIAFSPAVGSSSDSPIASLPPPSVLLDDLLLRYALPLPQSTSLLVDLLKHSYVAREKHSPMKKTTPIVAVLAGMASTGKTSMAHLFCRLANMTHAELAERHGNNTSNSSDMRDQHPLVHEIACQSEHFIQGKKALRRIAAFFNSIPKNKPSVAVIFFDEISTRKVGFFDPLRDLFTNSVVKVESVHTSPPPRCQLVLMLATNTGKELLNNSSMPYNDLSKQVKLLIMKCSFGNQDPWNSRLQDRICLFFPFSDSQKRSIIDRMLKQLSVDSYNGCIEYDSTVMEYCFRKWTHDSSLRQIESQLDSQTSTFYIDRMSSHLKWNVSISLPSEEMTGIAIGPAPIPLESDQTDSEAEAVAESEVEDSEVIFIQACFTIHCVRTHAVMLFYLFVCSDVLW
jgi:hypothetical protein